MIDNDGVDWHGHDPMGRYADDPLIRDDHQGGVCCILAWC